MSDRTATCWTLTAPTARLCVGRLTATLDLTQPRRGLHDLKWGDVSLDATALLGVDLPLESADELSLPETYVRGGDLVAVYSATAARPWRVQTYWRAVDSVVPEAAVLELQVSINTGLLDVHPAIEVISFCAGTQPPRADDGRRMILFAAAGLEYWQAVHPDDPTRSTVQASSSGVELRDRLFDRFLEKGVILRSRILAALVPQGTSVEPIFAEFAAAPLPLTT